MNDAIIFALGIAVGGGLAFLLASIDMLRKLSREE